MSLTAGKNNLKRISMQKMDTFSNSYDDAPLTFKLTSQNN